MHTRLAVLALVGVLAAAACDKPFSPTEVTSIVVKSGGGVTTVSYNTPLQFIAEITPADATNRSVTWSVVDDSTGNSTDLANIDANGIFICNSGSGGSFTVTATANDGSGVKGSFPISAMGS